MLVQQLRSALDTKPLAPVYLVVGPESFFRSEAVRALREAAAKDGPPAVTEFEPERLDLPRMLDDLRTPSLFAARRIVILDRADAVVESAAELLLEYAKRPSRTATFVIVAESLDTRRKGVKPLMAAVQTVECPPLKAHEIPKWLMDRARGLDRRMDIAAARRMADLAGADLGQLDGHLRNVALMTADAKSITADDVERLVADDHARKAWELSDAVANGQPAVALKTLDRLFRESSSAEGAVVPAITRRLRDLFAVKRLAAQGMRPDDIARSLGRHPYAVQKMLESVQGVSYGEFRRRFHLLLDADVDMKTAPSGERRWVLERLILALCDSGRRRRA